MMNNEIETKETKKIIDLGWANSWFMETYPDIIRHCEHGLKCEQLDINGNIHRYTCEECGFSYMVDGS